MDSLALLLGDQEYFWGARPTTLDALVFASLHVIYSVMAQSGTESQLRKITLQYDNLYRYSRQIYKTWFVF